MVRRRFTVCGLVVGALAPQRNLTRQQRWAEDRAHFQPLPTEPCRPAVGVPGAGEVLFTLLSERYERKSVLLSTNLVFSEWTRIFEHPLTTGAAIDRVVHHSVILNLMGMASYRAQAAKAAQQEGEPAPPADAPSTPEEPAATDAASTPRTDG